MTTNHPRTVTLADGRTVPSDSPEWQAECLTQHRHVQTLLRMRGIVERRQYLEGVARSEGNEAADRLRRAFTVAWQARQEEGAR